MVSSNIIPVNVTVFGWYKQAIQIIFPKQCNGISCYPN